MHILTDKKELAVAIEMFAGDYPGERITLRHVETIDAAVAESESPDLIIGSNLNTPPLLEQFRPMAVSAEVYPVLKGPSDPKGAPLLQPLSFELPLIMGRKDSIARLPDPVIVRPEDLRALAPDYAIRNGRGRLTRMSFSPSWNPAIFTDLLAIRAPGALGKDFDQIDVQGVESVLEETRPGRRLPPETGNRISSFPGDTGIFRTMFSLWREGYNLSGSISRPGPRCRAPHRKSSTSDIFPAIAGYRFHR